MDERLPLPILSSFGIRGFSPFNQILLDLFDVWYGLYLSCLYCLTHFCFNVKSNTIVKRALEMSNKLKKI